MYHDPPAVCRCLLCIERVLEVCRVWDPALRVECGLEGRVNAYPFWPFRAVRTQF